MPNWSAFCYGLSAGGILVLLLTGSVLPETIQTHKEQGLRIQQALKECEETLPRNQHCDWKVETFVVEDK